MKMYSLAIRLPEHRSLNQDILLNELLKGKRTLSYSRTIEKIDDQEHFLEEYNVVYFVK